LLSLKTDLEAIEVVDAEGEEHERALTLKALVESSLKLKLQRYEIQIQNLAVKEEQIKEQFRKYEQEVERKVQNLQV